MSNEPIYWNGFLVKEVNSSLSFNGSPASITLTLIPSYRRNISADEVYWTEIDQFIQNDKVLRGEFITNSFPNEVMNAVHWNSSASNFLPHDGQGSGADTVFDNPIFGGKLGNEVISNSGTSSGSYRNAFQKPISPDLIDAENIYEYENDNDIYWANTELGLLDKNIHMGLGNPTQYHDNTVEHFQEHMLTAFGEHIDVIRGNNKLSGLGASTSFQVGDFYFGGLLAQWSRSKSTGGFQYSAKIIDATPILKAVKLIIGKYVGPSVFSNIFNLYGFYESDIAGSSGASIGTSGSSGLALEADAPIESGMPLISIINAFNSIQFAGQTVKQDKQGNRKPYAHVEGTRFGGPITFGLSPNNPVPASTNAGLSSFYKSPNGQSKNYSSSDGTKTEESIDQPYFYFDFSDIYNLPINTNYFVRGEVVSLYDMISNIYKDAGYDFSVELKGDMISTKGINRRFSPNIGVISTVVDNLSTKGGLVSQTNSGIELAPDNPVGQLVIGGNIEKLYESNSIRPVYGMNNGFPILGVRYKIRVNEIPGRITQYEGHAITKLPTEKVLFNIDSEDIAKTDGDDNSVILKPGTQPLTQKEFGHQLTEAYHFYYDKLLNKNFRKIDGIKEEFNLVYRKFVSLSKSIYYFYPRKQGQKIPFNYEEQKKKNKNIERILDIDFREPEFLIVDIEKAMSSPDLDPLWDAEKEKEFNGVKEEIARKELRLKSGDIKPSEAQGLATDLMTLRAKLYKLSPSPIINGQEEFVERVDWVRMVNLDQKEYEKYGGRKTVYEKITEIFNLTLPNDLIKIGLDPVYQCSDSEYESALQGIDPWSGYVKFFKPDLWQTIFSEEQTVRSNVEEEGQPIVASQTHSSSYGAKQPFAGDRDDFSPSYVIGVNKTIDPDETETPIERHISLYNFIKSMAEEFFGKVWAVGLPNFATSVDGSRPYKVIDRTFWDTRYGGPMGMSLNTTGAFIGEGSDFPSMVGWDIEAMRTKIGASIQNSDSYGGPINGIKIFTELYYNKLIELFASSPDPRSMSAKINRVKNQINNQEFPNEINSLISDVLFKNHSMYYLLKQDGFSLALLGFAYTRIDKTDKENPEGKSLAELAIDKMKNTELDAIKNSITASIKINGITIPLTAKEVQITLLEIANVDYFLLLLVLLSDNPDIKNKITSGVSDKKNFQELIESIKQFRIVAFTFTSDKIKDVFDSGEYKSFIENAEHESIHGDGFNAEFSLKIKNDPQTKKKSETTSLRLVSNINGVEYDYKLNAEKKTFEGKGAFAESSKMEKVFNSYVSEPIYVPVARQSFVGYSMVKRNPKFFLNENGLFYQDDYPYYFLRYETEIISANQDTFYVALENWNTDTSLQEKDSKHLKQLLYGAIRSDLVSVFPEADNTLKLNDTFSVRFIPQSWEGQYRLSMARAVSPSPFCIMKTPGLSLNFPKIYLSSSGIETNMRCSIADNYGMFKLKSKAEIEYEENGNRIDGNASKIMNRLDSAASDVPNDNMVIFAEPSSFCIPLQFIKLFYGPWYSNFSGPRGGPIDVEFDQDLKPGTYGGIEYLQYAAQAKIASVGSAQLLSESGDLTFYGLPEGDGSLIGLGSFMGFDGSLSKDPVGPALSNIQIKFDPKGGNMTTYQFQNFAPRFGVVPREFGDKLKGITNAQNKSRADSLKLSRKLETASRFTVMGQQANYQIARDAFFKKKTPHECFYSVSMDPIKDNIQNNIRTGTKAELTTDLFTHNTEIYKNITLSSFDAMFRPYRVLQGTGLFSERVDPKFLRKKGSFIPGFEDPKIFDNNHLIDSWVSNVKGKNILDYTKTGSVGQSIAVSGNFGFAFKKTSLFSTSTNLNPLFKGNDIQVLTFSDTDGFYQDCGNYQGGKSHSQGFESEVRSMGIKAPAVMVGWGFDRHNSAPTGINPLDPSSWKDSREHKAGPIGLYWDSVRKIWSASDHEIVRAHNYTGIIGGAYKGLTPKIEYDLSASGTREMQFADIQASSILFQLQPEFYVQSYVRETNQKVNSRHHAPPVSGGHYKSFFWEGAWHLETEDFVIARVTKLIGKGIVQVKDFYNRKFYIDVSESISTDDQYDLVVDEFNGDTLLVEFYRDRGSHPKQQELFDDNREYLIVGRGTQGGGGGCKQIKGKPYVSSVECNEGSLTVKYINV